MSEDEKDFNQNPEHVMPMDYHEKVMGMLNQAINVQGIEEMSAFGTEHHQQPNYVFASFSAEYQTNSKLDSNTSQIETRSGTLVGERSERFVAPRKMGISVIAETFHDKPVQRSMEIKPSANGTLKEGQIQKALPNLVSETIENAKKEGRDADKYLRQQPVSTKTNYFYTGQPSSSNKYMTAALDPSDQDVQNRMLRALSNIKASLETRLTDLQSVQAEFTCTQKFNAGFGLLNDKYPKGGKVEDKLDLKEISFVTKDIRVGLSVHAKLNSGVEARFFEAGTGGLEGLRYTFFDTSDKEHNKVVTINNFDEVIEHIAEHVADKLIERDSDENISALGQSAPVVLSQRAAAYLMYAVSMYASGTVIMDQMLKENKKTLQGKIGSIILPTYMNIVINGEQHPSNADNSNRYGSMLIDAEGTVVRPLQIVENGLLKRPMSVRKTLLPVLEETTQVKKFEAIRPKKGKHQSDRPIHRWETEDPYPLYGCARRKDYSSDVVAAPSNIDLLEDESGPKTLDGIIDKIGKQHKGLFVESADSISFDSDGHITLSMDLGYSIENGTRNTAVRYNKGNIHFNYNEIKDSILAISGPGTAMKTPFDAQVASGQVMPMSVKSPMIAFSKADFQARSKYSSQEYNNYIASLEERGFEAFYEKLGKERNRELLHEGGPQIFTAIGGHAKIIQETLPSRVIVDDTESRAEPTYKMSDEGDLLVY